MASLPCRAGLTSPRMSGTRAPPVREVQLASTGPGEPAGHSLGHRRPVPLGSGFGDAYSVLFNLGLAKAEPVL
eukprot:8232627-Lingulodinium_polyedra.AAC.1